MFATITATPARAYASDGFLGGLQDLVGTREGVDVSGHEQLYLQEYEPVLLGDPPDPGTNELTDTELTLFEQIQQTIQSFKVKIGWGSTTNGYGPNSWYAVAGWFLWNTQFFGGTSPVLLAVGLVFMWWGVRKSIQMVMSGFRKGSMNV